MDDLVRLGFAVVLLLVALYVAIGFLAVPMAILRRTGVLRLARVAKRALRWLLRRCWRGLIWLVRCLTSRRRPRIRRPLAGAFTRLFK